MSCYKNEKMCEIEGSEGSGGGIMGEVLSTHKVCHPSKPCLHINMPIKVSKS